MIFMSEIKMVDFQLLNWYLESSLYSINIVIISKLLSMKFRSFYTHSLIFSYNPPVNTEKKRTDISVCIADIHKLTHQM